MAAIVIAFLVWLFATGNFEQWLKLATMPAKTVTPLANNASNSNRSEDVASNSGDSSNSSDSGDETMADNTDVYDGIA